MHFIVLGSGAGGGLPQWNCNCQNCRLAWAGDPRLTHRTQTSLAISANGEDWALLSASPDLRQQIIATPELHPRARRHSPISAVLAPNGDIDNITGLLTLREAQPFALWATAATLAQIAEGPFKALDPKYVARRRIALEEPFEIAPNLRLRAFAVPGKPPLYCESGDEKAIEATIGAENENAIGVEITHEGRRAAYIPSCARMTPQLRARLNGLSMLFFDGTLFENDELQALGLSHKTAWRMGHMAVNGPDGSMAALADLDIGQRIYIHINNSNPMLRADSPERAAAEQAGWRIAFDGMRLNAHQRTFDDEFTCQPAISSASDAGGSVDLRPHSPAMDIIGA